MSWLSELFGGGGEDPEAVRQREAAAAAAREKQFQDAQAAQLQAILAAQQAPITAQATSDAELQAQRDQAANTLAAYFPSGFEQTNVPGTADDALIQSAYDKQFGGASDYLTNLLKRNVVTQQGYDAGVKALGEQGGRVRTQLNDIGDAILAGQRQKLTDIYGRGQEAAANLRTGQSFDPTPFTNELAASNADFASRLPDLFSANVPEGLFDTSGLASVAGAAQGATNLAFDPFAVAGGTPGSSEDDTTDQAGNLSQKKRATTVF